MTNYYELLGVSRDADVAELKRAYRALVKVWHPDVCKSPDAHQKFIQITEAYEILKDPQTRAEYDALLLRGSHTTPKSEKNYYEAKEQASARAEEYWSTPLSVLLATVLIIGAATVAVGKYAVFGEENIRKEITFSNRIGVGLKGILLLVLVILTFTGVLAPATIPLGFLTYRSLNHKGHFVGMSILFESTLMVLAMMFGIIGIIFGIAVGSQSNNSSHSSSWYSESTDETGSGDREYYDESQTKTGDSSSEDVYTENQDGSGESTVENGNTEEAQNAYDQATELVKQFRYEDAIGEYQRAILLKPDYAEALSSLGWVYARLNRFEQAIATCNRAIEISPDNAEALNNLGWTYLRMGNYRQTIIQCEKAIQLRPDYVEAHYNLGLSYYYSGDRSASLEEYRIVRDQDPKLGRKLGKAIGAE